MKNKHSDAYRKLPKGKKLQIKIPVQVTLRHQKKQLSSEVGAAVSTPWDINDPEAKKNIT